MGSTPTNNFGYIKKDDNDANWGVLAWNVNVDNYDSDQVSEHRAETGNKGKHGPKVTIVQTGNDNALVIDQNLTGTGITIDINRTTTGASGNIVDITDESAGGAININLTRTTGSTGIGVFISNVSSATGNLVEIDNSGTGYGISISQNSTSSPGASIRINQGASSGEAMVISRTSTATTSNPVVQIDNRGVGISFTISQSNTAGIGTGVQINQSSDANAMNLKGAYSAGLGYNVLAVSNSGTGAGVLINSTGDGPGITIDRTNIGHTGNSVSIVHFGTGNAIDINKTTTEGGVLVDIVNYGTGSGNAVSVTHTQAVDCVSITKTGTDGGVALSVIDSGITGAMVINQTGAGIALKITQPNNQEGLRLNKTYTTDLQTTSWLNTSTQFTSSVTVYAMAIYNNKLYAGMQASLGVKPRIYESSDGINWTQSTLLTVGAWIGCMVVHNDTESQKLFAATDNGYVYSFDGSTWTQVCGSYFATAGLLGNPNDPHRMVSFGGYIYVCCIPGNAIPPWPNILRSVDGATWETDSLASGQYHPVYDLAVYNDELYALKIVSGTSAVVLKRSSGGSWSTVYTIPDANMATVMAVWNDKLYFIANKTSDATKTQLFQFDGASWSLLTEFTISGAASDGIIQLFVSYDNALYVGYITEGIYRKNWVTYDGVTWQKQFFGSTIVSDPAPRSRTNVTNYRGRTYFGGGIGYGGGPKGATVYYSDDLSPTPSGIYILNSGSTPGVVIQQDGSASYISIEQNGNERGIRVRKYSTGTGHAIYVQNSTATPALDITSSNGPMVEVAQWGDTGALVITQTNNLSAVTLNKTGTGAGHVVELIGSADFVSGITGPYGGYAISGTSGLFLVGAYGQVKFITYPTASFPANGITGTVIFGLDDMDMYVDTGTAWNRAFIGGDTGIKGTTGLVVDPDAQGVTGLDGVQGITGTNSLPGNTGVQGDTGIRGITGSVGSQGITGVQGITGAFAGQPGVTGLRGVTALGSLQVSYDTGNSIITGGTTGVYINQSGTTQNALRVVLYGVSSKNLVEIANSGSGAAVNINSGGGTSGIGLLVTQSGANTVTTVVVNQRANQHTLDLNKISTGAGNVVDINNNGTGYDVKGHNTNWYMTKTGTNRLNGKVRYFNVITFTGNCTSSSSTNVISTGFPSFVKIRDMQVHRWASTTDWTEFRAAQIPNTRSVYNFMGGDGGAERWVSRTTTGYGQISWSYNDGSQFTILGGTNGHQTVNKNGVRYVAIIWGEA